MDRADLLTYITDEWGALGVAAGVADVTVIANRAVDAAYAQMGYGAADLPDPALTVVQAQDAPWLADYFTLRSLVRQFALQVDFQTGGDMKEAASQRYDHAKELLAEAQTAIDARGYGVGNVVSLGRLSLDLFEPGPYLGGPL